MSRLIRILVALVLIGVVVAFSDWRSVGRVLRDVHDGWLAAALALALLDRLIINVRYDVLLRARGVVIGFWKLLRIQLAANFLGSFLPSSVGVDAVRIAALCRSGHPTPAVVAATLIDRITLALATLIFGCVTLLALAGTRVPPHVMRTVLVMTGVVLILMGLCLTPTVRRLVRLRVVPRLPERMRATTHHIADAALSYRHDIGALSQTAVITLVLFFVRIGFAQSLARACGVDVAYTDLLLVIPILWIVVMLPITVGGIGVQDAGYVVLMAMVGVSAAIAFSMSILEHVISRVASLPGLLFMSEATRRDGRPVP